MPSLESYKNSGFTDHIQIKISSGCGGRGSVHFQRTRRSPRAGPDGGDGGRGGDLFLSPESSLKDFSHLTVRSFYKAEDGKKGEGNKKRGARGKDLTVYVPKGTFCYDSKGQFLKELTDKKWCVLKGGKGGRGNCFFKSSRRQAPQSAQPGEPALQKKITLELKWLSDVCLIGFRGSGKTSLLLKMGGLKEKLYPSSYPRMFSVNLNGQEKESTTKSSHALDQHIGYFAPAVFVDLPGLSPSTRKFLKQAEKTKIIVFVLSLTDVNPFTSYQKLREELLFYDQKHKSCLTQKPSILLLSGEKNSSSLEKVEPFHKELLKIFYFFSVNNSNHLKNFRNEILKKRMDVLLGENEQ